MKFLITVSSIDPGSGLSRYVLNLCRILSQSNEVIVMTTHNDIETSYAINELNLISQDIKLISLGTVNKYARYIKAVRVIIRNKPDVIVNNYNAVIQYILPAINKRIKVVHILHNDTTDFYRVAAINGRNVDSWIAPTKAIAEHFNVYTHNYYADKVHVIPHGVEYAEFTPRNNPKLELLYAGVLYEHKGVKILPDIVQGLRDRGVNFHLTIIGGGILQDWLKEKLSIQIKHGMVSMTGIIEHKKVYELMGKADIFLYPTHLDAFGLVIAEAMMNGAIPVVTLLPGITDNLITHNEDGFLLPQDDVTAFSSTIINLNSDKRKRSIISRQSHEKSRLKFSMDIMAKNYIHHFQQLV